MIKRDGYPICAKETLIPIAWSSANPDDLQFVNAHLTFKNINVIAGVGEVVKESTSLPFTLETPVEWPEGTPAEVEASLGKPADALRTILGLLYESDEHQYRLRTKERPPAE